MVWAVQESALRREDNPIEEERMRYVRRRLIVANGPQPHLFDNDNG